MEKEINIPSNRGNVSSWFWKENGKCYYQVGWVQNDGLVKYQDRPYQIDCNIILKSSKNFCSST